MADKPAVTLIIAGSGSTTEQEVFDLLDDAYPEDNYDEIGFVVPTSKELFTESVKHVLSWASETNQEKAVTYVVIEGEKGARLKFGDDQVETVDDFTKVLNPSEYDGWDEVHFLVAMPDDEDDPEYEVYAELAGVAIDNGLVVKDLTRGLDDVHLADDEPEPEPEPEHDDSGDTSFASVIEKVAEVAEAKVEEPVADEPVNPWVDPKESGRDIIVYGALLRIAAAFTDLATAFAPVEVAQAPQEPAEPPQEAPAAAEEAPRRGRGRPRENFEVSQVWDEDDEKWVPRPKGRQPKGTKWRKIHSETGETLDEGVTA